MRASRPWLRKLARVGHVATSVGWLGAVATVLVLAVAGMASADPQVVRAAYLTMEMVGWYALVPMSVASLLTGLVSAFISPWGLLRHYWVLFKFVLNIVATGVLLLYMQTLGGLAAVAADEASAVGLLRNPTALVHSVAALLLLLAATVLAVYKPTGVTGLGRRLAVTRRPGVPG
ncbi:MAG TPA: DUF2269 domain-containing protein [Intrasporangium sp.]|uniref:DUF2269 domain-containing protein n=1 Tax=Intrasporangium sp. TaxID=1925024 RepID=UPI002D77538A|nr:DUF2269 domain-containing protein [Intrasporangium sp.]HET7397471.1 DUF2269 domain-containing protein [Intrasporangium sp.]